MEQVQPSIAKLTQAYLYTFPEILEYSPDFLQRVVQFTGFGLIQRIQAMIEYEKSFGNAGIAMLQVAKTLLCRPEQSMPTIFGTAAAELNRKTAFALSECQKIGCKTVFIWRLAMWVSVGLSIL